MIVYEGGNGASINDAVIIRGACNHIEGVAEEYRYISNIYGKINVEWGLKAQSLIIDKENQYDVMEIVIKDNSTKKIYFNISDFFSRLL
ncbi:MAG: hypothetical protein WCI77_01925 [Candidatus Omnitrophota bacterium]